MPDRDNISRFLTTATKWNETAVLKKAGKGKEQVAVKNIPSEAMTGRLRLVRAGGVLYYFAAEDWSDNFTLLHTAEFGAKDLKSVRVVAATGGPGAAFDVRATDLRIRAEAFPRDPSPRNAPARRGAGGAARANLEGHAFASAPGHGTGMRGSGLGVLSPVPCAHAGTHGHRRPASTGRCRRGALARAPAQAAPLPCARARRPCPARRP